MAHSGVYALAVEVPDSVRITARRRSFVIPRGTCVYCGSAMGPGGVEARVARHLRRFFSAGNSTGRSHWHIDSLLVVACTFTAVSARTSLRIECALAKSLASLGMDPLKGFGNTDCREGCSSHLLCTRLSISGAVRMVEEVMRGFGLEPLVSETVERITK